MGFSSTEHLERLEQLLEPIRDLFAAVFLIYACAVGYVLVMSIVGTMLMQYSTPIEAAIVPGLSKDLSRFSDEN